MNYTQKELTLLHEQRHDEMLCTKKYKAYSNKVNDSNLSALFSDLAYHEQQHYDTLTKMINGTVPDLNQEQQNTAQQAQKQQQEQRIQTIINTKGPYDSHDADICRDSLNNEKYVSGTYNSAIFEFKDTNTRQVLNHIQKEEQEHGEKLFTYMKNHDMYNMPS